jgi:SAM-dependent methyltransferase
MGIMATELDPAGMELRTIHEMADLRNSRVLEVGAGDGRLTFRYAMETKSAIGIDPKQPDIQSAARSCREELRAKVHFLCASTTALPFPAQRFDVVLLASSLWWVAREGMVDALLETRRVLVADGIVIDIRPITAPAIIESVSADRVTTGLEVDAYGAAEDEAAADAAVRHALSHAWFVFHRSRQFDFEVYYDSVADLKAFVETSKRMRGASIPYQELEERRSELGAATGQPSRLRCHRPWMVSVYCKAGP